MSAYCAQAARSRVDEHQAKLRHGPRAAHDECAADALAVSFRDEGALAGRIEPLQEVRADPRHEGFEVAVETVLALVQFAVQ